MALVDLALTAQACEERRSQADASAEVSIPDSVWHRIITAYRAESPTDKPVVIGGHTLQITTPEDKKVNISCQELIQIWAYIPYAQALLQYKEALNVFAQIATPALGRRNNANETYTKFPSATWRDTLEPGLVRAVDETIEAMPYDAASKTNFIKFLSDPNWSGVAKKLNREDWMEAALLSQGGWLAQGGERRGDLILGCAKVPDLEPLLKNVITNRVTTAVDGGQNVIYYGAPGTGKSHAVNNKVDPASTIRTVFHTDTLTSDFIGCLKPSVTTTGSVTYEFMPGPFSKALAWALKNPHKHYWLVVEEINRAPAASVFGEVFQLLDRTPEGRSQYEVSFSDPAFQAYLKREADYDGDKFYIPSNLSILATMNSSDQGVMPMDTAFKRRWEFSYVPLDFAASPTGFIKFKKVDGSEGKVSWVDYASSINQILSSKSIPEDRHLGPFFLTVKDLQSGNDALTGKLFIYLWDDVLRHNSRLSIFAGGISTYGELVTKSKAGQQVYSTELLQLLELKVSAPATAHT